MPAMPLHCASSHSDNFGHAAGAIDDLQQALKIGGIHRRAHASVARMANEQSSVGK